MVPRIQTNLGRYPDAELIQLCGYIVTCMTDNPDYPDPVPAITDVDAALAKFKLDATAAAGGDKVLTAEKNKSRDAVLGLFSRLGMSVMALGRGDAAKLARSGFPKVKSPEKGYITNPASITVKNGPASGQVVCRVKPVKYALMYNHEISTEPPTSTAMWTSTRSSKSHHMFTNLQPGTRYWFRVAAIRGNEMAYSQVASQYAQ